jgi:hypothetical protein
MYGQKIVDNLSVDLIDGRTLNVPLSWYPGHCCTLHRNNARIGKYTAVVTASIGWILMKI